ncbi:MAG: phosphate ABC transporter permease PstA [Sphingomonadales bacterium]|nr:phosphate ABC transporter permease PstA [Sphingomonadales bacterium]
MQARIRKRYASERRFKFLGLTAVVASAAFLAFLLLVMLGNGIGGFSQTRIALPIDFETAPIGLDPDLIRSGSGEAALAGADFRGLVDYAATEAYGPGADAWFSGGAWEIVRARIAADPDILLGKATFDLPAASDIDVANKGDGGAVSERAVADLERRGVISKSFNSAFLTGGDATDPALAGIWGALKGSLLTMAVTLALAFPIGVLASLYLEEYAPQNRWTDIIEVSINNLAAVPSIIFGLLALAVFINFFGMPTSSPLVGGLTLALMTMPVIVIAGRNAIKSVPPSIRDAALGVGASRVQVVFHHVLPLALPGILTGTIIGMARALGETAPLLLIGMRAFIADPPAGLSDAATVLPMQIFLWSDEVDKGFVEKTSAAIIVLLVVLLTMNALAVYFRNRFEKRW